ncbi:MAG: sigma factor-like helix-turn-helix DNA-binding protein [Peptoniphilaceae bacterium]|nr:sigma factor-like helix-turn-helix DNA-binding protein [Peptoniphilaceae bacterium]
MELTKKQLESVPVIKRRIAQAEKELKELEADMPCDAKALTLSHNPTHSNYPKGIDDQIAKYLDDIEALKRSIEARKKYLVRLLFWIHALIDKIEDPVAQEIVELRCVQGLTFEEIGSRIHYSESGARRIYFRCLHQIGVL